MRCEQIRKRAIPLINVLTLVLVASCGYGKQLYVSVSGDNSNPGSAEQPWRTVQFALDNVSAGDTINVRDGIYSEFVRFNKSGSARDGHIVLRNEPGHSPVLDATGITIRESLPALVKIVDHSYIQVSGFEIRNLRVSNSEIFPAGVWVRGAAHHIEISDCEIHDIGQARGGNGGAHGLAVYGTRSDGAIHDIVIANNEVHACVLGGSEALALNGNVMDFVVSANSVHDCDNIGYDFIGFEGECENCTGTIGDNVDRARDGLVIGNLAFNIDTRGNPAYGNERNAGGFYVDGGANIIFEKNIVFGCNLGFELASEHFGKATQGIIVRSNFIFNNHILGISTGGFDSGTGAGGGEARNNFILNNTFYKNTVSDNDADGWGAEILLQNRNTNNIYKNNIVYARTGRPRVVIDGSRNRGNGWGNQLYFGSSAGSTPGAVSTADPRLVMPDGGDLHVASNSPTVDAGETLNASIIGAEDIDGNPRVVGSAVDIGAHEVGNVASVDFTVAREPETFALYQNYPNPFNPATNVRFLLPQAGKVLLQVYNVAGQVVATLVDGFRQAGAFDLSWQAATADGAELAAGLYFMKLSIGSRQRTIRLVLLK